MTPVIEKTWSAVESACNQLSNRANVSLREEAYSEFKDRFSGYYKLFLEQFMTANTRELDEHKQAAVIVISIIESNAIQQSIQSGEIPLAPYAVALNVGLSFLLDRINEKLERIGHNAIEEFQLPFPIACNTPYFESLCRILYYEDVGVKKQGINYPMSFNIVDWADRFFLLEYILLQQNQINPKDLR